MSTVHGDPSGYPSACAPTSIDAVLSDLVAALASGDTAAVAALLADLEGGDALAAELVAGYGTSGSALTRAVLRYGDSEAKVGLDLQTDGGGGPSGRFGCESGSITALG